MRLSHRVGGILPRVVIEPSITVKRIFSPPSIDIKVANYAIHHNEEYFPEPFLYHPNRSLQRLEYEGGLSAQELECGQSAYTPFSFGPANCLGRTLVH
jgi:cytochrome P450